MIRWLERNGYDVAYATNLDVFQRRVCRQARDAHRGARRILEQGHARQRRGGAGSRIHLGIFAANVGYWQIRRAVSLRGVAKVIFCARTRSRIRVRHRGGLHLTVRFRDSIRAGRKTAQRDDDFGEDVQADFVPVPAQRGHWVFAGTGITKGATTRLPGLCGYEVDRSYGDDSLYAQWSPPGLTVLARVPIVSSNGNKTVTESTVYTGRSGAIVFAAGTMQWSGGL